MGLSLLFSAWIFYRATGAAFNPSVLLNSPSFRTYEYTLTSIPFHRNVSFALLLIGVISPTRFILYAFSQFLGSIGMFNSETLFFRNTP